MGIQKEKDSQDELFKRNARQLAAKVKVSESCTDDSDNTWRELEEHLYLIHTQKQKQLRRKILLVSSIAACFSLLTALSIWHFIPSFEQSALAELSAFSKDERPGKEISLIALNKQFSLQNGSTVTYGKNGTLSVNQKQINRPANLPATVSSNDLNHLIVPKGRRVHITLSDGTKLYVNAGSHVVYPTVFNKSRREIAVEGEAYLEVSHQREWPFYVQTNGFNVRVLGTTFNISAYKEEAVAAVTLVEGSVEIERKDKKIKLTPDHIAFISADGMSMKKVDVFKYICWKDNMILLNKDLLGSVLKRLSRYYGVTISYDTEVANIPLSGKLDLKDDIGTVLSTIGESLNLYCLKRDDSDFYFSTK